MQNQKRKSRLLCLLGQQRDLVYKQILEARKRDGRPQEITKLIQMETQLKRLIEAVKENNYLLMNMPVQQQQLDEQQ